ncbi:MAG: biopolymer transporter ExbD [Bacteroidota bacterium]
MSAHFKKKSKAKQEIPTASLPDIIFMLLIFFMVTTVLRETELLVITRLPQASAVEKIDQKRLIQYIYVGEDKESGEDAVQINDALINDLPDIRDAMYRRLLDEPRTIVSLNVDRDIETGMLYDVQQELREADALRVNYSTASEAPQ